MPPHFAVPNRLDERPLACAFFQPALVNIYAIPMDGVEILDVDMKDIADAMPGEGHAVFFVIIQNAPPGLPALNEFFPALKVRQGAEVDEMPVEPCRKVFIAVSPALNEKKDEGNNVGEYPVLTPVFMTGIAVAMPIQKADMLFEIFLRLEGCNALGVDCNLTACAHGFSYVVSLISLLIRHVKRKVLLFATVGLPGCPLGLALTPLGLGCC